MSYLLPDAKVGIWDFRVNENIHTFCAGVACFVPAQEKRVAQL